MAASHGGAGACGGRRVVARARAPRPGIQAQPKQAQPSSRPTGPFPVLVLLEAGPEASPRRTGLQENCRFVRLPAELHRPGATGTGRAQTRTCGPPGHPLVLVASGQREAEAIRQAMGRRVRLGTVSPSAARARARRLTPRTSSWTAFSAAHAHVYMHRNTLDTGLFHRLVINRGLLGRWR